MEKSLLCLFLFVAMGSLQMVSSQTMDHIVGGSFGWSVPANVSFYENWAKPRTFGLGDKIVFMYRSGMHNIIQVDKKEFDACTQNKPIDMKYNGPTIIELTELGDFYYYDGVGTHCESGQKVAITVTKGPGSSGMFGNIEASPIYQKKNIEVSSAPAPAPTSAATTTSSTRNFVVGGGLFSLFVSWLLI